MSTQERDDSREELLQAVEEARDALFSARGTRKEGDAQGELARAENALAAHDTETAELEALGTPGVAGTFNEQEKDHG